MESLNITDREMSNINNLIHKFGEIEKMGDIRIRFQFFPKKKVWALLTVFNITKLDDDWWYVYIDGPSSLKYYKCDQLEGLLMLLTDIIVKPKIGL